MVVFLNYVNGHLKFSKYKNISLTWQYQKKKQKDETKNTVR